jgi:hypothetical protein
MQIRCRLVGIAAAMLAIAAGATQPTAAQQATSELESFRVPGWSFTPGVAIGAVFDSNVAIAGPDQFGKTASDSMMEIEPMGQLEFFSARTSFSSGYRGSLRRYFELSDLDGLDHRIYATLRHRLTRRVTLSLNNSFQRQPTTDALELNGLPFVRIGSRHNLLTAGIDARLTKSLDLNTGYEMTFVDFVGEETALSDGIIQGVHTELVRRIGERWSAGAEYGVRRADLNTGAREFTYQNAGGVLHYRTGEHTTFDLSGGLTYLVDRGRDETRTGPYVHAALVHRAARATLGGEYRRNYTPSFTLGGSQRSHEARAYVDMPFSRNRFYVQESAAWRRTDPFGVSEPFGLVEPALDSIRVMSTLGYAIQRWLRLEGNYTFATQDNRLAGGRVTRHLAGVQIVVSEPMRIR